VKTGASGLLKFSFKDAPLYEYAAHHWGTYTTDDEIDDELGTSTFTSQFQAS
jgi:hypothetical protein